MKEFKRLDFPLLREYYTKYPHGYTIYESLLDILEHINEMTDTVNLTLSQWREIETWVLNELKNYSIDQLQTWLDNGTLEDVINDALFNTKADKTELVSLETRLKDYTNKQVNSLDNANATERISLKNYLGNNQNIHPKVLYFPDGWNGWNYWMAYTPYPDANNIYENPCIAVSYDLHDWAVPSGLVNPLSEKPTNGYNSDTHLVYRADTDTLEIWWRSVEDDVSITKLFRRTSTDGVNWTPTEHLFTTILSNDATLSPSILFENGKYKMWSISSYRVQYRESYDAKNWTDRMDINMDWGTLRPWHLDVIHTQKGYEMVITAFETDGGSNNTADLYYVLVKEDGSVTKPVLILRKSANPTAIDSKGIYRASLLYEDDVYCLIYSSIGQHFKRNMSLSIGREITALNGLKLQKEVNRRTVTIYDDTLEDYDVSMVDTLFVYGNATIKSLKGGYRGKIVRVVITSLNSTVDVQQSSRLNLPNNSNFKITRLNMGMTLVCTNNDGTEFRGFGDTAPAGDVLTLTGDVTLNDYDLSGVETVFVTGSIPTTINSLSGGLRGQKVTFVVASSNGSVIFKSTTGRLFPPEHADLTFNRNVMVVTAVCTDPSSQVWRVG